MAADTKLTADERERIEWCISEACSLDEAVLRKLLSGFDALTAENERLRARCEEIESRDDGLCRCLEDAQAEVERLRSLLAKEATHSIALIKQEEKHWPALLAAESRLATAEAENERLRKKAESEERRSDSLDEAYFACLARCNAAESRLATAVGLLRKTSEQMQTLDEVDDFLESIDSAQPAAPARTHDRDDCDNPDCGTCMFNPPAAPKCNTCKDSRKVIGDCGDSPNLWFDPCPDCQPDYRTVRVSPAGMNTPQQFTMVTAQPAAPADEDEGPEPCMSPYRENYDHSQPAAPARYGIFSVRHGRRSKNYPGWYTTIEAAEAAIGPNLTGEMAREHRSCWEIRRLDAAPARAEADAAGLYHDRVHQDQPGARAAKTARTEAEPESDWERELRFWREHPVDRFDLEECGSGYMSYRDMQRNETGDWVRSADYRKAVERTEAEQAVLDACAAWVTAKQDAAGPLCDELDAEEALVAAELARREAVK